MHPNGSLTFSSIKPENEGVYECEAVNTEGNDRIKILLEVLVKPVLKEPEDSTISVAPGLFKELPCIVLEGKPSPVILWFRDCELLDDKELLAFGAEVHPNGSLIFSFIKRENVGTYECEAVNTEGKDRLYMLLDILDPPFISGEEHLFLEVRLGESAQLPCAAHGDPKPHISWKKDNLPLRDLHTYGWPGRDESLYIIAASNKDNGTYQCIASNAHGEARKTISVIIREKPKITPMEEHIHPTLGEEVTLNCEVRAFPEAEIKWFKNGVLLDSEDISYSSNEASLRLIADVASFGKYECIATNDAGQDKAAIDIFSIVAPYITYTNGPKVSANIGDNVSLLCFADGFPPPTYGWAKYPEVTPENGSSILTFYNVQHDQEGIYVCEAQNGEGSTQSQYSLNVLAPPEIKSFQKKYDLKILDNFELECLADGKPNPTIHWLKDGTRVDPFYDDPWLYINDVSEADAGLYTCRAKNYGGVDEKYLAIEVQGPPTFKRLPSPVLEVNVSESVLLSCPPISGRPPPTVQWMKDGRSVSTSWQKTFKDKGKTLQLKNVAKYDAGVYVCVATNLHGRAQAELTLEVLQAPRFTKKFPRNKVTKGKGTSIDLDCSNDGGYPEPKVSWQKDSHPLPPSITSRVTKSENGHIVTINRLELTDTGRYKCIVENKAHRIEHSFRVEVIMSGGSDKGRSRKDTWGEWSKWSECSPSCGHSEQVKTRKCHGSYCGDVTDSWRQCNVPECKVNGGWSSWRSWSPCSATCGSGKRYRTRLCNNPSPQHDGTKCPGRDRQGESCNTTPCPVDGAWSEWSYWSACAGPCPTGIQKRMRKCSNPGPTYGGKPCDGEGIDYRACAQKGCPGEWLKWSSWSSCSATCGHSIHTRERICSRPKPEHGMKPCEGDSKETENCDVKPCDKIPTQAIIHVDGSLNGHKISGVMANMSISDSSLQRSLSSSLKKVFKEQLGISCFPFLVSPVTWVTAAEKNKASNGFTLTKGVFKQTSFITFMTGEELVVTHKSHGLNSDGILQLDAHIQGSVPLFPSILMINPFKEYYIQTAPGVLNAIAKGRASSIMYSSIKNITFEHKFGTQKYLSEVLSVYNISFQKKIYIESASIDKTEDADCRKGFYFSGEFCQDVDECADRRTHICHPTQSCVNTFGAYTCECPFGYISETKGTPCKDVDECSLSLAVCSDGCKNLDGSFQCLCPPGLQLLKSNTTCTSTPLSSKTRGKKTTCLPQQKEVEGFCEDRNICEGSTPICREDEVCLSIRRGRHKCIPFPCPPGHHRIKGTKICAMECSKAAPCDSGAQVSQKFVPVVISSEDPIRAYKDLVRLPIMVKEKTTRKHTVYRILENEKGKPFRVKIEDGVGSLYSKEALSAGKQFRVVILGSVYDDHEEHILHASNFSVVIDTHP